MSDPFDDIVARLPELAEIQINPNVPMYLTLEWVEAEDSFKIVATNCDSQEEVVWMLTGLLAEFACGEQDFCPEMDAECADDEPED